MTEPDSVVVHPTTTLPTSTTANQPTRRMTRIVGWSGGSRPPGNVRGRRESGRHRTVACVRRSPQKISWVIRPVPPRCRPGLRREAAISPLLDPRTTCCQSGEAGRNWWNCKGMIDQCTCGDLILAVRTNRAVVGNEQSPICRFCRRKPRSGIPSIRSVPHVDRNRVGIVA